MKVTEELNGVKICCEYSVLLPINELKPHDKNPNQHSTNQIDRLVMLIKQIGVRHPIIVSKLSNKIVAGHGRLEAFKQLGLTSVPVDYQDFENEDLEYAFLVSDNAIAEWSELDQLQIDLDIKKLSTDFDISLLALKDFKPILEESEQENLEPHDMEDINFKFTVICSSFEELQKIREHFQTQNDEINFLEFKKLYG